MGENEIAKVLLMQLNVHFCFSSYLFSVYSDLAYLAEKAMAPHSITLAWKIPWTEEPGGLQSTELQRVGHD